MADSSLEQFKKQLVQAHNSSAEISVELETLKEIVKIERDFHFNKGTGQARLGKIRDVVEKKIRSRQ